MIAQLILTSFLLGILLYALTEYRRSPAVGLIAVSQPSDARMVNDMMPPSMTPTAPPATHSTTASIRNWSRMVRRVTGSELLAEVGEFFAAFEGMYDGFRSRAQRVYDLLKDPGTQFVVVATPDEPALREAAFFADCCAAWCASYAARAASVFVCKSVASVVVIPIATAFVENGVRWFS